MDGLAGQVPPLQSFGDYSWGMTLDAADYATFGAD